MLSIFFFSFSFFLVYLFSPSSSMKNINDALISVLFLFYTQGMKRNDKNSARDMSDYKPASFDRGGNGKYASGGGGRKGGKGKKR